MNLLYIGEVRYLITEARKQGFIFEHRGKSFRFIPPDKTKPIIVVSCTPSDRNIAKVLKRDLRKAGMVI